MAIFDPKRFERWCREFAGFESNLDPGIRDAVRVLYTAGIECYESCQGGPGHAYPEPTVAFHGGSAEGFRAFTVARENGLPVGALQRQWRIEDGELVGPTWLMVFNDAKLTAKRLHYAGPGSMKDWVKGWRRCEKHTSRSGHR